MGEKGQHWLLETTQCFKMTLSLALMLKSRLNHGEGQHQSPLRLSPCAFYRHIPPVICLNLPACAVGNTALSAAACLVSLSGFTRATWYSFNHKKCPHLRGARLSRSTASSAVGVFAAL